MNRRSFFGGLSGFALWRPAKSENVTQKTIRVSVDPTTIKDRNLSPLVSLLRDQPYDDIQVRGVPRRVMSQLPVNQTRVVP